MQKDNLSHVSSAWTHEREVQTWLWPTSNPGQGEDVFPVSKRS